MRDLGFVQQNWAVKCFLTASMLFVPVLSGWRLTDSSVSAEGSAGKKDGFHSQQMPLSSTCKENRPDNGECVIENFCLLTKVFLGCFSPFPDETFHP